MKAVAVVRDTQDPYRDVIADFFGKSFPEQVSNALSPLDGVTDAILGSGQTRLGPRPSPEEQVALRLAFKRWIDKGEPIPVLALWGSKKPCNDASIDIADVAGLKSIACLAGRVQQVYRPGIRVVLRIEDLSGWFLFEDEKDGRTASLRYVADFLKLLKVLNLPAITPVLESQLMDEGQYNARARNMKLLLREYLVASDSIPNDSQVKHEELTAYKTVVQLGWKGTIPGPQRQYYRDRYAACFPGISANDTTTKMATYFASALARHSLKGLGILPEWGNDFIFLAFTPPVPGIPEQLATRRVYIRTLPEKMARTHIPPWRARGLLKVNGGVTPKIASWNEKLELHPCSTTLTRDGLSVEVGTPYTVE